MAFIPTIQFPIIVCCKAGFECCQSEANQVLTSVIQGRVDFSTVKYMCFTAESEKIPTFSLLIDGFIVITIVFVFPLQLVLYKSIEIGISPFKIQITQSFIGYPRPFRFCFSHQHPLK